MPLCPTVAPLPARPRLHMRAFNHAYLCWLQFQFNASGTSAALGAFVVINLVLQVSGPIAAVSTLHCRGQVFSCSGVVFSSDSFHTVDLKLSPRRAEMTVTHLLSVCSLVRSAAAARCSWLADLRRDSSGIGLATGQHM